MKTIYLIPNLFFALMISINAFSQTKKKPENSSNTDNLKIEEKKVIATIEKMVSAFQSKDIGTVITTYEDNAIVMFEPQKPVQGKEKLRMVFTQFVEVNPKYVFNGHEVYITGNIATHITPWKMTGTMPDGTKIEQNGLSVAILRKQKNGDWLIIQDNPHGQFLMNK